MTARVPGLAELPPGLMLDGERVAFDEHGAPHWPLVVELISREHAIPVTFMVLDLLRVDGHDVTCIAARPDRSAVSVRHRLDRMSTAVWSANPPSQRT